MTIQGPIVGSLVPTDEIDPSTNAAVPEWIPRWLVDVGGTDMGIIIDDHCFVVLAKDWYGNWKPTRWLPWQIARRLGELSDEVTP